MQERTLSFKITSHSNSTKTNEKVLRSITGGKVDDDEVRVIYSDTQIEDNSIKNYYNANTLIIALTKTNQFPHIYALKNATGCRIAIPESMAGRLIEDIFLDIFMGRWLTGNESFAHMLAERNGMRGFFKQKTKFFKRHLVDGYIRSISNGAGYAPLSTLNTCANDDIGGRSSVLAHTWQRFRSSLTVGSTRTIITTTSYFRPIGATIIADQLASIPVIGKQIPIRRITYKASNLPDGNYILVIQRKSSSARKTPKIRGWMIPLFGERSRINSFVFLNSNEYNRMSSTIKNLETSGHLYLIAALVRCGKMDISS